MLPTHDPWMRKRRRGHVIPSVPLLLALVGAACTQGQPGGGVATTAVHQITGWLHTSGTTILDAQNRPLRLVAVNVQGMGRGSGIPEEEVQDGKGWAVPSNETYENIAAWGFNSVRLPIAWANLEPEPPTVGEGGSVIHRYNQRYLAALDGIIDNFSRRGIAVILCMCQHKWSPGLLLGQSGGRSVTGSGMPAWLYPDSVYKQVYHAKRDFFANMNNAWDWFTEAWKMVVERYAEDPTVVGVDVLNEPYYGTKWLPTPDDLHLDELYERVGKAIREINPRLLLIFEDSQDRGDGLFGMHRSPPFPNVVYSFHLYTDNWQPEGVARTLAYWERARGWGVPLWIGEFNRFGKAHVDWQDQLAEMLRYVRDEGIGWAYWGYGGNDALVNDRDELSNPELLGLLRSGF